MVRQFHATVPDAPAAPDISGVIGRGLCGRLDQRGRHSDVLFLNAADPARAAVATARVIDTQGRRIIRVQVEITQSEPKIAAVSAMVLLRNQVIVRWQG